MSFDNFHLLSTLYALFIIFAVYAAGNMPSWLNLGSRV